MCLDGSWLQTNVSKLCLVGPYFLALDASASARLWIRGYQKLVLLKTMRLIYNFLVLWKMDLSYTGVVGRSKHRFTGSYSKPGSTETSSHKSPDPNNH